MPPLRLSPTLQILVVIAGLLMTCACGTANAGLMLSLNTTDKTFALIGSDTGTPGVAFGIGNVTWRIPDGGGGDSGNNRVLFNDDVAFSTDVGEPGAFGFDTALLSGPGGLGPVELDLRITSVVAQTITGSGIFLSYAPLSAANQANLEAQIGKSLPLITGSGFSPIPIQAHGVPEPSSLAVFGSFIACVTFYRKKGGVFRKKRSTKRLLTTRSRFKRVRFKDRELSKV